MTLKLYKQIHATQDELQAVAEEILSLGIDVIILSGLVGSGKTALTQALLTNIKHSSLESSKTDSSAQATSPTFMLMHDYGGVYHYDLYQRTSTEVLQLGLLDWLSESGVHCIEWGEELLPLLLDSGFACMLVKILVTRQSDRIYEIYAQV
ncbi:tRNA (adenosine(37)-N6)-threonylcarbamoyltransferase complex ATPase subunit type 1 TsaE [Helicobacter sp.]|uniref:tRNA (adenosine(37)-N6)-threonylcarbamoyltransferase complex ATPase subunit type 1 TsaE n=1 Tax=Helicobacter sp. TaxID=218 RepID=UPI0025B94A9F|nr:tRNA (adenosine(37)-N6)-threonylcarbamoyltransferase complex ATPase subunit type 1 TsaE [Helicobacter sp.]MBR2494490.1 tRNA (adenosine(37)-N6)-threonylcarbamoyltransferase complex ATPase subunit type 1 TsaE [Helicobacter sp.]